MTAERDGSNAHKLTNYEVNSRYHWKDDRHIMIWSALPNFNGEYGIFHFDDVTCQRQRMDDELVNAHDIHCLYSPDRTCFIGDDYPRNDFTRRILYYDFETKGSGEILSLFSDERGNTDIRCDLHNRFSPDSKLVSFDTNYTGRREILMFPFDKEWVFA